MGILDEAIRELAREKQAAEDDARQAIEDFDMITSRAIDTLQKTYATLRVELEAAGWWTSDLGEDAKKPTYLRLNFSVRRTTGNPDLATNSEYSYAVQFDALGGAIRTAESIEPLLEPVEFRGVARADFGVDLERDLKNFLKAILARPYLAKS